MRCTHAIDIFCEVFHLLSSVPLYPLLQSPCILILRPQSSCPPALCSSVFSGSPHPEFQTLPRLLSAVPDSQTASRAVNNAPWILRDRPANIQLHRPDPIPQPPPPSTPHSTLYTLHPHSDTLPHPADPEQPELRIVSSIGEPGGREVRSYFMQPPEWLQGPGTRDSDRSLRRLPAGNAETCTAPRKAEKRAVPPAYLPARAVQRWKNPLRQPSYAATWFCLPFQERDLNYPNPSCNSRAFGDKNATTV